MKLRLVGNGTVLLMDEKLSFDRVVSSQLVYVELESGNGGMLLSASEDGFCFRAVAPLKPTGPVAFAILLGAKQRLEGKGKLVWSEEEGRKGGILFTEVTPQFRREFETWLHRKETRSAHPVEPKSDVRQVPPAPEDPKKAVPAPPAKRATPPQAAPRSPEKKPLEQEPAQAVQLDALERALRKQQPLAEPAKPAVEPPEAPAIPESRPSAAEPVEQQPPASRRQVPQTPAAPATGALEKIAHGFRLEAPSESNPAAPPALTLRLPLKTESDTWTGLPRLSLKPLVPSVPPQVEPVEPPPSAETPLPEPAPVIEEAKLDPALAPEEPSIAAAPVSEELLPPEPKREEQVPVEPAPREFMEQPSVPAPSSSAEDPIAVEFPQTLRADMIEPLELAPGLAFETPQSDVVLEPHRGIGAVYKTLVVLIVLGVLAILAVQYRRPLGESIIRFGRAVAGDAGASPNSTASAPANTAPSRSTGQQAATPSVSDSAKGVSAQPPAATANNSSPRPPSSVSSPSPTPANPAANAPANDSAGSLAAPPPEVSSNPRAAFDQARRILHGDHRSRDMEKAVELLLVGASQGYAPAQVTLGDLYARGDGVPKDCNQARTLLQAAVRKGSPDARRMLAKLKSESCP